MTETKIYDVIIIGGSYAGLSAAMSLGRARKNILIIDSGKPCNRQTPFSHNFITQDGVKPFEIFEKAKAQVLKYHTVKFINDLAIQGKKLENSFEIITESKISFTAKKLIFASGIKDIMPDIKGFSECWGISVIHCPYCHGYEFSHQKTGILLNNEKAFHIAQLVNNLTDNLTILTNGPANFEDEQLIKLKKHGISIIEKEIIEIEHHAGHVKNVIFNDWEKMEFNAIYSSVPFVQHSNIPKELGCELTDDGYLKVDDIHKTTIEGIYAIGDNAGPKRSVANAVASGSFAGAVVNMDLTKERF